MKLNILISLFVIVFFYNCHEVSEKKTIQRKFYYEKQLPSHTLDLFVNALGLQGLISGTGVERFEIRKWGPFIKDSFPLFMQRFYYENAQFKGEIYFFSDNNGNPLSNINDVKNIEQIKFEKFLLGSISTKYLDSLRLVYNLYNLTTFDTGLVNNKYKTGYILHEVPMLLLEQSSDSNYIATFTRYPEPFSHLNQGYFFLSSFYRFIDANLIKENIKATEWIDSRSNASLSYLLKIDSSQ